MARRIVVVGTGTGVGKTHVGCALIEAWGKAGRNVVGLKPVESGVSGDGRGGVGTTASDQERLGQAGQAFHVKQDGEFHARRPPYAFADPVSPHLAARRASLRIDLAVVRRWVAENAGDITLVETAGGLFSPLDRSTTNFDLVRAVQPALVLLVAPDRLGVLHDVTTSLGLASVRGLKVDALVLSVPEKPDASTGSNAAELGSLGIALPVAVFPWARPEDPESQLAAKKVITWALSTRLWSEPDT